MKSKKRIGQAQNRRAMVAWAIPFMIVVAVVAAMVMTMYVLKTSQTEVATIAATNDAANLLANALVSLPECFAYEEGGRILGGVMSEEKLEEGNERADCVGLGPLLWAMHIVRYDKQETELYGTYKMGNMEYVHGVGVLTIPKITMWREALIKGEDGVYAAKMLLYVSSNMATMSVDSELWDAETEMVSDTDFGIGLAEEYDRIGTKNMWNLKADIINLTDHSLGCGENDILDNDNLYVKRGTTPGSWINYLYSNIVYGEKYAVFSIRDKKSIMEPYTGPMEGCGIRFTAFPIPESATYQCDDGVLKYRDECEIGEFGEAGSCLDICDTGIYMMDFSCHCGFSYRPTYICCGNPWTTIGEWVSAEPLRIKEEVPLGGQQGKKVYEIVVIKELA